MIAELGHFSLILAFCLSLLLAGLPLAGATRGEDLWMHLSRPLTAGIFVFLGLSTMALGYAFATDDFSVSFCGGAFQLPAAFALQTHRAMGRA